MFRAWLLTGIGGLIWASVGCGRAEEEGPTSVEDFAGAVAQTFCDSLGECCEQANESFDGAACRGEAQATLLAILTQNEKMAFDKAAARACLDQLKRSAVCGEADDTDDALSACEEVLVGTVPVGGSCGESDECQPDGSSQVGCELDEDASNGVCTVRETVPVTRGRLGEACDITCDGDECSVDAAPGLGGEPADYVACFVKDGLHCPFAPEATCQPLAAVGKPCDDSDSCVRGAYCDFTNQLCAKPQANGARCDERRDCVSRHCDYTDGENAGTCAEPTVSASECANPDVD
jgi:hypothetical protein